MIMRPTARASARPQRYGRTTLIARLWKTAGRQVKEIETRLIASSPDGAALERDAKTLAVLARTVRELDGIDEADATFTRRLAREQDDDDSVPRDVDGLRDALALRIAELRDGGAA